MVKGRFKEALWEKQRMGPDGNWVHDLEEKDGPAWERAPGKGDESPAAY